MDIPFLTM